MFSCSRRDVLGVLGGALIGGAASVAMPNGDARGATHDTGDKLAAWLPHKLDAQTCAPLAYDGYWHNDFGCCYGTFYSIVGSLGKRYGAPYNQFPFTMMEVGKSGISEWGTICGALLGAASAFALFWGRKERDPMVTELFRWYEQTALPKYDPGEKARGVKGMVPTGVPGSVLCHLSVSTWSFATGIDASSTKRSERCSRITADVAIKAIEIMNAKIDGTFASASMSKAEEACGSCHGKGKSSPISKGRMDCTPCHSGSVHVQDKFRKHP
ncbi:MAG: C_GCAxxG_C_C family protein [Desulfovibrio sp.]|nr:C_GCAxxG_C_C family protein [Desulfovibrio sp.]MBI4958980.1 C_GCAxxG_C_C family protein [Desulfovibrio sp.]